MSVKDSHARLSQVAKELGQNWSDLKLKWRDDMAINFEKKYIDPLEMELRKSKSGMEQLAALVARIKRECS